MKEMCKKIVITLIVTYLLFQFYFKSIQTVQMLAVYGGCLFYLVLNIRHIIRINRGIGIVLGAVVYTFCLCILWYVILVCILQTYDFTHLFRMYRVGFATLSWFCAFLIIYNHENKKRLHETYLLYFVRALSVHVCFTITCLLIPSLRTFWIGAIAIRGDKHIDKVYYITRFGLQGFADFMLTGLCSIGIIVIYYIMIKRRQRNDDSTFLIKYLILLIAGTLFYGRVGLFSAIVSTVIFLLYNVIIKRQVATLIKISFVLTPVVVILLTIIANNDNFMVWYNWSVGPFINLFTTGDFGSASFNVLGEMYGRGPTSLDTILFGDGRYTQATGSYYMNTDIGWMRLVYIWGIFPTALIYISLICLYYKIGACFKKQAGFFFALLLLINAAMFEIKAEMVYNHITFGLVLLWAINVEKRYSMTKQQEVLTVVNKEGQCLKFQ